MGEFGLLELEGGWPATATLLGLVAGTFASSCMDRLPEDAPLARPLLTCASCGARAPLVKVIPILGSLVNDGRCRSCRSVIPSRRPVVEAVNAVLWLLLSGALAPSPRAFASMFFLTALLILSVIDMEHQLLPDVITLPSIALGVAAAALLPGWPVTFLDSALTAGVGYFAMMLLAKTAEVYYGEEALGQGDWKMVAMLGAFLGATKVLTVLLAATVLGAVVGLLLVGLLGDQGRQRLPLGTFMGAAGMVMVFV